MARLAERMCSEPALRRTAEMLARRPHADFPVDQDAAVASAWWP